MIRFAQETVNGTNTGANALARTTDGGLTWKTLSTLITTATGALAMERNGQRAWVMQNGNSYVTTDVGATWTVQPVPSTFGNLTVSDIYSNSSITDIWTAGYDVFRYHGNFLPLVQAGAGDTPEAIDFAISSLFPNPVSSQSAQVVAAFTLPTEGMTTFDVYDNSGRFVRRACEAVLAPGNHALRISLQDLPTGTYFCRLQSAGKNAVKQLMIIN